MPPPPSANEYPWHLSHPALSWLIFSFSFNFIMKKTMIIMTMKPAARTQWHGWRIALLWRFLILLNYSGFSSLSDSRMIYNNFLEFSRAVTESYSFWSRFSWLGLFFVFFKFGVLLWHRGGFRFWFITAIILVGNCYNYCSWLWGP